MARMPPEPAPKPCAPPAEGGTKREARNFGRLLFALACGYVAMFVGMVAMLVLEASKR